MAKAAEDISQKSIQLDGRDPEKVKEVGNSVKEGVIKWLERRRKNDEAPAKNDQ